MAQRAQVTDCDAAPRSSEDVTQKAERSDEVSSTAWDQEQDSERRNSGAAAGTCGSVAHIMDRISRSHGKSGALLPLPDEEGTALLRLPQGHRYVTDEQTRMGCERCKQGYPQFISCLKATRCNTSHSSLCSHKYPVQRF